MDSADVFEITFRDAERLDINLRDHSTRYRVVTMPADFYSLMPGSDALRPPQRTPVPGLTLAGDETRQPHLATMEGAVVSGRIAAQVVATKLNDARNNDSRRCLCG